MKEKRYYNYDNDTYIVCLSTNIDTILKKLEDDVDRIIDDYLEDFSQDFDEMEESIRDSANLKKMTEELLKYNKTFFSIYDEDFTYSLVHKMII